MHRDAGRTAAARLLLLAGLLGWAAAPAGAEEPLSVTYGPAALSAEGDQDYRELIYLSVPDTTTGRLYLRVFDADVGGAHDTLYGAGWDGEVRYALFGGKGAAEPPAAPRTEKPARRGAAAAPTEPPAALGGERLAETVVGEDAGFDDGWRTLASVRPDQGDHVDGRYVFRLEVTGLSGNDGNTFTATLSTRDRRDAPPEGLAIVDHAPTVRVLDNRRVTEVALDLPAAADRIVVENFDLAAGQLTFESTWRSVPLTASGQDEWQRSTVELLPEERGATASIVAARGQELPNDLTLFVTDGDGRLLPLRLPAVGAPPNARPVPVADYTALADCSALAFDASRSSDPEGEPLRYRWEFGDGTGEEGVATVHRYPGPGTYSGVLRVRDGSPLIGNGAALPFEVTVKRPPKAVAGPDVVVAPGVTVAFDGTASTPGDRPIASYAWDFQDGTRGAGPKPSHAFARSGRYVVTLRVQDDRPGACDSSSDQLVVDVNAAPVAVAGPDRHVAVGETVELTGAQSYDVDGKVASWAWDLGDGTKAEGVTAAHAYTTPGNYLVTLTVRDDAGLANSTATSTARIVVNDPPVAEAGADRTVAVGEPLTFDAAGSVDRDGKLVHHDWDFGDGSAGSGASVQYAYDRPGTFRVTLTVTDDSGSSTSTASDLVTVVVNAPPVAQAGEDQIVTSSEVRFDAAASEDPDGAIARFAWDFGDGTTGEGKAPVHVYRQPGDYRVRLTVTDDSGTARSTATDSLRVLVNQAPIADAGRDQIGAPGQELDFSGVGSLDPDGDVVEYSWDFQDGATASGERVTHQFDKPGTYQVRLTVRDDTRQPDALDFDEAEVAINAPPVANAGADMLAAPGDTVVLDAGNSFDRDGSIASHRWEFSDGAGAATGRTVTRTYPQPGVYGARLTVTDDSGAINAVDQDEVAIRVNHAPVANAGRDVFTSSNVVSFDGSASADADGDALVYRWDFGDGSPPAGGVKVTHTYAEGGTYPVVLTVDDGTGVENDTAIAAVTIKIDRPPVADAGGNREVCAGDVVVLDGSRSMDPEGGLLRYAWDFGDGTAAEIVNPTKTYLRGAAYPVTLTVEDDFGLPGQPPHRPRPGAGRRIADRGRRTRPARLRWQRGPFRRLGLARLGRRRQPVHLELRRRQHRRRRAPGARVRGPGRVPGRPDHRGRRDRPVRQHQLRRDGGQGGRGAARAHRGPGQRRGRRPGRLRRLRLDHGRGRDRGLAVGFRRRRPSGGRQGRARLPAAGQPHRHPDPAHRGRSRCLQGGDGAAFDHGQRAAGRGRGRGPCRRDRRGGPVRRWAIARPRRRHRRLRVGLRRRIERVRHQRPAQLPRERPLRGEAGRDRQPRPAEQPRHGHGRGHGQPAPDAGDRGPAGRLPRRAARLQRRGFERRGRQDRELRLELRRRCHRHGPGRRARLPGAGALRADARGRRRQRPRQRPPADRDPVPGQPPAARRGRPRPRSLPRPGVGLRRRLVRRLGRRCPRLRLGLRRRRQGGGRPGRAPLRRARSVRGPPHRDRRLGLAVRQRR